MDVREAVQMAKRYVSEVFAGEMLNDVGLEEVVFDEDKSAWNVTIGFSRPWDDPKKYGAPLEPSPPKRTYLSVQVDDASGRAMSLKRRRLG